MQIEYVIGDLIDAPEVIIAHGCNAKGKFESGMAGAIRARLPFACAAYLAAAEKGEIRLGEIVWAYSIGTSRPRIVANMITQPTYGRVEGRVYISYDAVEQAMQRLELFVQKIQNKTVEIANIGVIETVGFPLIGCGLAHGSWKTISQIIEHECRSFQPVVYTLDGHVPQD